VDKMKTTTVYMGLALACLLGWVLLLSPEFGSGALGAGINMTLNTTVNITNAAPEVRTVIVNTPINLEPYGEVYVNCTAVIFDWDNDTLTVNGTFFMNTSASVDSAIDNNTKYFNSSCSLDTPQDRLMNYTCTFNVQYYADNSTHWLCNVSAEDDEAGRDSNQTNFATVNPLVAIYIPATVLNFGEMKVNDISTDRLANLTNAGNRNVSIYSQGWGTNPYDGLAMSCTYGNISLSYMRYNFTSGENWLTGMTLLTNDSTIMNGYLINHRINDSGTGDSTNTTYWKLRIPTFAGGLCSGKILFTALDTNN
jgi:hypothetical protein